MNKASVFGFSILPLFLVSCSGSSGSQHTNRIYYSYGSETLSGVLSPLDSTYRPSNLSEKSFTRQGIKYAPIDIENQTLALTFDINTQITSGRSIITFRQSVAQAHSLFLLDGTISNAMLDGTPVSLTNILDPDNQGQKFWSIDRQISNSTNSTLEFDFTLPSGRTTFADGGARFLTDMTDLYTARFFELWGPTSLEQDAFQMNLNLKVLNSTSSHRLFTNGDAQEISPTEWQISFPNYFTTSSFYVHLTNNSLITSQQMHITGIEKTIPITVYSQNTKLIQQSVAQLPGLFQEFERDFGAYPHDRFIAYLNGRGGGMEYSGATITSVSALDHELFHSWFARSVMPAEGRSGWIDEALASWRDYGYFQAPSLLLRWPTQLSGFSPFRKSTPENCYRDGRQLIAELDRYFATYGGMKPIMKLFFERYKNRVVTNEEFWNFLKNLSQQNVDPFFQRYTLGLNFRSATTFDLNIESVQHDLHHPPPLTPSEIEVLR